ncbi:hypothetical protein GPECTOR_51g723 [Gonium pectorale]|uniref:Pentacotripeptide-repeat region of PRORP domain-containing protein n=1 Tax=Gonium pectorale TaxID=33097 RepID=A0A150G7B6_GONPE|nr:hypothetical protein GPECTOR_51g723 [Gonium pectorale]|eukprot:KXZ45737.1 hypothetical protein GPECTOR_51g723 [Gonium pectorale]
MMPLSLPALGNLLNALLHPPRGTPAGRAEREGKLAAVMAILDRDLPPAAPVAGGGASLELSPRMRELLSTAALEAVSLGDWATYRRLEAVLKSRTRQPLPYNVLLKALRAAAQGGERDLAMDVFAELQVGRHRRVDASREAPADELSALSSLLGLLAERGDAEAAERVYERMRSVAWRGLQRAGADVGDGAAGAAGAGKAAGALAAAAASRPGKGVCVCDA